jgi:hypothetical protein
MQRIWSFKAFGTEYDEQRLENDRNWRLQTLKGYLINYNEKPSIETIFSDVW